MMDYDLFGVPIVPQLEILRIPHQGSKNSIALNLLRKMLEIKPKAKYFVDLFGGGGSMSFTALQLGLKVIYNEKQTSLVNFIKFIIDRINNGERGKYGLFPDDFYNFISRKEFFDLINQDTLKSQFARICYSFGNNQKDYAFGKDVEESKHLGHNIVVFQCKNSLEELNKITNSNFVLSDAKTLNKRRFDFMSQFSIERRGKKEEQLQQLQHLEQLEQLQQLERLEQLTILNLDFQDVVIDTPEAETIVYLDPPYRNTRKYLESALHSEVDNYFRNLPHIAFMSEYDAPFSSILELKKRQLMCNTKAKATFIAEKLFINKAT